MKRIYLILLGTFLVAGIGARAANATETVFHSTLVTSTDAAEAARTSVELAKGGDGVALTDGTATVSDGEVEIDDSGKVTLSLHGISTGSKGLLFINQGDVNGVGGTRDFVFSAPFTITAGNVDAEFADALPSGVQIEDVLITVLLDDGNNVLESTDPILAVPGVKIKEIQDTDGDGVPDEEDHCPDSDLRPTVIIGGCNTGVTNDLVEDGCTISDRVGECAGHASNHGRFVSCVASLTNELKREGTITGREKGAIQSCAAQAHIP